VTEKTTPQPVVVLASGRGSNLLALLEQSQGAPYQIVKVVSDQPQAGALGTAERHGIATATLSAPKGIEREAYGRELAAMIDTCQPKLVVLAGFMRILSAPFVAHYAGRMLNIHPSLLPKYPGLHTHRRALAAADTEHGATVHFVTEQLDGGPGVLQARVPVLGADTEETLAARVLVQEHRIYPLAVRWFCDGRLRCEEERVWLDGRELTEPVQAGDLEPEALA
jgi:phosphoribosylglycinamide formyltransferase 1